jgi:hypothetical protein
MTRTMRIGPHALLVVEVDDRLVYRGCSDLSQPRRNSYTGEPEEIHLQIVHCPSVGVGEDAERDAGDRLVEALARALQQVTS